MCGGPFSRTGPTRRSSSRRWRPARRSSWWRRRMQRRQFARLVRGQAERWTVRTRLCRGYERSGAFPTREATRAYVSVVSIAVLQQVTPFICRKVAAETIEAKAGARASRGQLSQSPRRAALRVDAAEEWVRAHRDVVAAAKDKQVGDLLESLGDPRGPYSSRPTLSLSTGRRPRAFRVRRPAAWRCGEHAPTLEDQKPYSQDHGHQPSSRTHLARSSPPRR